jgi:cell division protein FtsI (penicillin-binding protein 3)
MVDVTSDIGTGWRARVEDLSLAVKTGTAQMHSPGTEGYSDTDFIANCIAMLPAESPSLILYLAIVKPQREILAGRIAAPPIREAAEALVNYLGIPRGRNPQTEHPSQITLPMNQPVDIGGTVPNFSGLPKRTILPLLLRDDLHIEIYGEGWVKRQSPPPGTPLSPSTKIILELE